MPPPPWAMLPRQWFLCGPRDMWTRALHSRSGRRSRDSGPDNYKLPGFRLGHGQRYPFSANAHQCPTELWKSLQPASPVSRKGECHRQSSSDPTPQAPPPPSTASDTTAPLPCVEKRQELSQPLSTAVGTAFGHELLPLRPLRWAVLAPQGRPTHAASSRVLACSVPGTAPGAPTPQAAVAGPESRTRAHVPGPGGARPPRCRWLEVRFTVQTGRFRGAAFPREKSSAGHPCCQDVVPHTWGHWQGFA